MVSDKCHNCGICCVNTEMILFDTDIDLIIKNLSNEEKEGELFIKNSDGLSQLNNIEGHCVFFDTARKLCRIYEFRPEGCRFYPLIFNISDEKCQIDEVCPRPQNFYQDKISFEKTCKSLRKYLKINHIF